MANAEAPDPSAALDHLERHWGDLLAELGRLIAIPSVSFPGFPPEEVRRCAEAVASLLRTRGLEGVEVLELEGAHPCVFGERMVHPDAPTVLLYGHYDSEPPGDVMSWGSPPFVATQTSDALVGCGAVDKATVLLHLGALDAWEHAAGRLPVNVKILIEGEEKTGSEHLPAFLQAHRDRLGAGAAVLPVSPNAFGMPSITVAMRGLVVVEVEVRGLEHPVHASSWAGVLPDPAMALSRMLASLVDANGDAAIPAWTAEVRPLAEDERRDLERLPPLDPAARRSFGVLPRVELLHADRPWEHAWYRPALVVSAIQASSRQEARNLVNDCAWARVAIRTVADMEGARACAAVTSALKKAAPRGLQVSATCDTPLAPWRARVAHPALQAARRALTAGYREQAAFVGTGGHFASVDAFSRAFPGMPLLVIGMEDPQQFAHSTTQQLGLDTFRKSARSVLHLLKELAVALDGPG